MLAVRAPGQRRRGPSRVRSLVACAVALAALTAGAPPALGERPALVDLPDDVTQFRLAEHGVLPVAAKPPADQVGKLLGDTLASANKYALNTWWQQFMSGTEPLASWAERYSARGTLDSEQVRRYSSVAMQLAATLATGAYRPSATGFPAADATDRAVELVQVLVRTHKSNLSTGGWGGSWQSGLWSSQAALAGWLLVANLSPVDQLLLGRMLAYEADAITARPLKYLRDRHGRYLTDKDSGAEELAWDAVGVFTAVELLPYHERRKTWAESAYKRFVGAYSRPGDVTSTMVVNGRHVSQWLDGSNAESSGWVVNHGKLNPDYTVNLSLHGAPVAGLAGSGVPYALLFNAARTYQVLSTTRFVAPPYRQPGGYFYVPNSAAFYYPLGPDWGRERQVVYGALDVEAAALGLDRGLKVSAATWAMRHLGHVRKQQSRFETGQIYGSPVEDGYFGREEHAGAMLARAQLSWWLRVNGKLRPDWQSPSVAKNPR